MANLIIETKVETTVTGSYETDSAKYEIEYRYVGNKLTACDCTIKDKQGVYLGNMNYDDNASANINNRDALFVHITVFNQLLTEIKAKVEGTTEKEEDKK